MYNASVNYTSQPIVNYRMYTNNPPQTQWEDFSEE